MTSFYLKTVAGGICLLAVTALSRAESPLGNPLAGDLGSRQPIFFSGKVVLNDGTRPNAQVPIELVCRGEPHLGGYTDANGNFTMQFSPGSSPLGNRELAGGGAGFAHAASLPEGFREGDLRSCDLRASMAGFRSDLISLADWRSLDGSDVGKIILYPLATASTFTISATSALAPRVARKAYEKGLEDVRKGKPDEAAKEFQKAVESYPRYTLAWFELGKVHEQGDREEQARQAYTQALAADSRYLDPYERLATLAANKGEWQETADISRRMIHLNPYNFPQAYYFHAVANLQLHQLDAAENSAREAVRLDPAQRNPRANYILGLILAQRSNFKEAAECLRTFLNAMPNDPSAPLVRKQLATVEKLAQATMQPQTPDAAKRPTVMGFH